MVLQNMNEFVLAFFQTYKDNVNLESVWMSPKNQQLLIKTIKKSLRLNS